MEFKDLIINMVKITQLCEIQRSIVMINFYLLNRNNIKKYLCHILFNDKVISYG